MKNRMFVATMALSVSLLAAQAVKAEVVTDNNTVTTQTAAKGKTIKVHMRNDSKTAVTIQGGDQQVTLQPGKEATIKVPTGTQLVSVNATSTLAAGTQVGTADNTLNGATLIIN